MKKVILLSCYFIGIFWVLNAAASGFEKSYGDSVTGVVHFSPLRDGGYILFGNTRDSVFNLSGYFLEKIDSSGNKIWSRSYSDAYSAYAAAIDTLPDGGYVTIGTHEAVSFNSLAEVIRYDSAGTPTTSNFYPPTGGWGSSGIAVLSNADNSATTNIFYDGFLSDNYYYISKLNTNLTVNWAQQAGEDGSFMTAQTMVHDTDRGYWAFAYYSFYFSGSSIYQLTNLMHYDHNGNMEYDSLYELGGTPTCLASTSDGGCIISGEVDNSGSQRLFFQRFDGNGQMVWRKEINTPSTRSVGAFITQCTDGGFMVAAAIADSVLQFERNILLCKLNNSGDSVWTRVLGSTGDDYPQMIRSTRDNGAAILNFTNGFGAAKSLLIKVDSTGSTQTQYRVMANSHYLCAGDSIAISLNPVPDSSAVVNWSNGETGNSINVSQSGVYSAVITDSSGATFTTDVFDVLVAPIPFVSFLEDSISVCAGTFIHPENRSQDISLNLNWQINGIPQIGTESDSIEIVANGWYQLTTSNYCGAATDSFYVDRINQLPVVPPIVSDGTDVVCPGDSLQLIAGSTQFVSYQWQLEHDFIPEPIAGATDTVYFANQEGFYLVQVVDSNGCSNFSDPFPVYYDDEAAYVTTSGAVEFCLGDSVQLSFDEGLNYQWSSGDTVQSITVTSSGQYFGTYTSIYGCLKQTDTLAVVVNPLPEVNLGNDTILCNTASITLNASQPAAISYAWNTGQNTSSIQLSTQLSYDSAVYWVSVTDSNGCMGNDSIQVVFDICSSVAGLNQNAELMVYPNPIEPGRRVSVILPVISNYKIAIYSSSGEVVDNIDFKGKNTDVYVNQPPGLYLLEVTDKVNNRRFTHYLILQ